MAEKVDYKSMFNGYSEGDKVVVSWKSRHGELTREAIYGGIVEGLPVLDLIPGKARLDLSKLESDVQLVV